MPDLNRSKGVVGYLADPMLDCLYLHLDGSAEGFVTLVPSVVNPVYVVRATGFVSEFKRKTGRISFVFNGHGKSWIEFDGCMPVSQYTIWVGVDKHTIKSGPKGVLRFTFPEDSFNKDADITLELEPKK